MARIGRLVPGKDSSSATDPSDDSKNTCTKSIPPSEWSGKPASHSYAKDGDQLGEDEQTSDGEVRASLDITQYVESDDTLKDVGVVYSGIAECDSEAASCSAGATTTVTFSNGSSTTRSDSADLNGDGYYIDTHETTDSSVTSIEAINDSSATTTRVASNDTDAEASATGTLHTTNITWETTGSCSGGSGGNGDGGSGGGNDTANTAPEAAHIYPEYSGNDLDQITLRGLASDVDGDTLTYDWYEGTDISGNPDGTGQSYSLGKKSCSYSQDWTLQVSDGDLTDAVTRTIEASNNCESGGGPGNPDQPIQFE